MNTRKHPARRPGAGGRNDSGAFMRDPFQIESDPALCSVRSFDFEVEELVEVPSTLRFAFDDDGHAFTWSYCERQISRTERFDVPVSACPVKADDAC